MDFSKEINAYIEKVVSESLKKINSQVALVKNQSASTVQVVDNFALEIQGLLSEKKDFQEIRKQLLNYVEKTALLALRDEFLTGINELETNTDAKLEGKSKELKQAFNKEITAKIKAIKLPDYTEEFASIKKYIDEQVKSVLASKEVSSQTTTVIRGGGGYAQVAQSGVKVKRRNTLNFIGATITDNAETGTTDITITGGGGGGAVDSVNGQTGVVVLDADDIDDTSTTHKFTTASDITKLAGIQAGAEVNVNADWNATSGDAEILNKPTIPSAIFSTIAVSGQSNIVADSATDTLTLAAGSGVSITTNATTDTITISASGGGGGSGSNLVTSFTSQTSVTVTHNFGQYPVVDVLDNTGAVIIPLTITHTSVNAFTVTFTSSTTGNIIASLGGAVTDGDKGDITVASGGTAWAIDNGAVTNAKVATGIDATKLADGSVTNTELQYINSLTSNAQTQLDSKADSSFKTIAISGQSDVVADSPTDTLTLVAGSNITLTTNASTDSITIAASGGGSTPSIIYYGNGSDGNVTITGTTTLTRDMYYDTLTIASGGILETAMFKVFAKTLIEIKSGGLVRVNGRNGNAATGQAGAVTTGVLYTGTLGSIVGQAGGAGSTGTNAAGAGATANTSAPNLFNAISPVAGNGGTGASTAGGLAGVSTNTGKKEISRAFTFFTFPNDSQPIGGTAGIYSVLNTAGAGGGGGGGASQAGGGGGGGGEKGGTVFLCSPSIIHNGIIEVKAGNGGNGANAVGTNAGGGGGGSGGCGGYVITLSETFTGSGTYDVSAGTGGTGGAGTGTGTAGGNGSTGLTGFIRRCVLNDNAIYTS